MAPPSATHETVLANLSPRAHPRFAAEIFPELWQAALEYDHDPVGMVAQSAKETDWWNYTGRVQPWFYNTAGIKVRHVRIVMAMLGTDDQDHPLVHQQFPNWRVGAVAHAQHLRAYVGSPFVGLVVDPRYTLVGPPFVTTWTELSGRWDGGGPDSTYGRDIEAIMVRLRGG